jgi:glycerophosphoryl diester phosphodiesterase
MSVSPREDFTPLHRAARDHVLCIAHRGASAYAPENSLEAFKKAAEMQADMVEVDIRITSDDRPVVVHDASLKRLYGMAQYVNELPLALLRSRTGRRKIDPVPTFEEVAFLCTALKLGLYLDIKEFSRGAFETILRTLQTYLMTDSVIFGAFRPDWLAEVKAFDPTLKTSILFGSMYVNPVRLAQAIQADYVHPCWEHAVAEPHRLLTPEWVQSVRDANLGIITWHEERPSEIEALVRLGVDGICSDTPDVLARLTQHVPVSMRG